MHSRDVDLYRLRSYKSVEAWTELWGLLLPMVVLWCIPFGLITVAGVNSGTQMTVLLGAKIISLVLGGSLATVIILVGSKHPDWRISGFYKSLPILVIGGTFI